MDTLVMIFAFLGFCAWLGIASLSTKVGKLERELRKVQGTEAFTEVRDMRRLAKMSIGKTVTLKFRENEGDIDLMGQPSVTILDADSEWLLVEFQKGKSTMTKLIRQEVIRGISEA